MILTFLQLASLQSAFGTTVFDWQSCVHEVRKNNAELRSSLATVQATEETESSNYSDFLPQLSASVGYVRNNNASKANTSRTTSINGRQNLFAGFQTLGRVRQAQANTLAASAALELTKARISFELKSSFESLSYSKDFYRLTQEIIHRREENNRLVELRFQSGRENKGSSYLSEAYLEQARLDALQASNAKRVATAQLARAIGIDHYFDFEIQGSIPTQEPDFSSTPDFRKIALRTPDYRQSEAQEEAADASVSVARSRFYPSLDLTGNFGQQVSIALPGAPERWSVGIALSLPFFTGGSDFFQTRSAIDSRTSAEFQRVNVSRQVLARLEQAYATYLEAVMKFKVDASFKKATTVRAEIARKRYNNGLLTFEDWDVIENDLINRQKSYLQSKRDRVIAEAAWEQAQGLGVFDSESDKL
jgi:outer membrane protein